MGQPVSKLTDAQVIAAAKNPAPKTVTSTVTPPAFDAPGTRYTFFKSDDHATPPNTWRCAYYDAQGTSCEVDAAAMGIDPAALEIMLARVHVASTTS